VIKSKKPEELIGTIWYDKSDDRYFIVLCKSDSVSPGGTLNGFTLFGDYQFSWCPEGYLTTAVDEDWCDVKMIK